MEHCDQEELIQKCANATGAHALLSKSHLQLMQGAQPPVFAMLLFWAANQLHVVLYLFVVVILVLLFLILFIYLFYIDSFEC